MHETLSQTEIYVTVDVLILTVREGRLRLMLSRRTEAPFRGCWALPGKFIGRNESAEKAVSELMKEMFPVPFGFMEQLYTFSAVNRDPRGRVISAAYLAILPASRAQEALDIPFSLMEDFSVSLDGDGLRLTGSSGTELFPADLAFDHGEIIEMGINRLRGKISYSDIGFYFLEDRNSFSLGDLQTVFEAVLARQLDSSNFRRMILAEYGRSGKIIKTGKEEKTGTGRPSALYRFQEE